MQSKLKFISLQDENFRKRKLPVVSSVVKVKRFSHDGEEEEEDDEDGEQGEEEGEEEEKDLNQKTLCQTRENHYKF